MAEKNILHMVTPTKHISPFDANMALDAGYDAVLTYSNVTSRRHNGTRPRFLSSRVRRRLVSVPQCSSAAETRAWRSTC